MYLKQVSNSENNKPKFNKQTDKLLGIWFQSSYKECTNVDHHKRQMPKNMIQGVHTPNNLSNKKKSIFLEILAFHIKENEGFLRGGIT